MKLYQTDTILGAGVFFLGLWSVAGGTPAGTLWGGLGLLTGAMLIAVGLTRWN